MTRYAIPANEFLDWAADSGVGFHPHSPDHLILLPSGDHTRVWALPADPATWPAFLTALLAGFDPWSVAYLRPRLGRWPATADCTSRNDGLRQIALREAAVPDGGTGAIRFDRDEWDVAVGVLCAVLAYGRHPPEDVWFVPDHCNQVVRTDHHGAVHAECRDEGRMLALAIHMERAGY